MTSPHPLTIIPETELQFTLSAAEESSRCTMTLKHPGSTKEYIAFKVKTTQPRRYLVRPNQGLIAPGGSEKVAIMLVEKDKTSLMQSYERLGQSALDHAKDKFLVQSCTVSDSFSSKFMEGKNQGDDNTKLYDALNTMWSQATGSGSNKQVQNKKLHVRLVVNDGRPSAGPAPELKPHETSAAAIEGMNQQQLFSEINSLRKKYDDLVSFSVNLTAERDILNNTLEQTKRELNKEMNSRAALENAGGASRGSTGGKGGKAGGSLVMNVLTLLVIALAAFVAGAQQAKIGKLDFVENLPVVGKYFDPNAVPVVPEPKVSNEKKEPEAEPNESSSDDEELDMDEE